MEGHRGRNRQLFCWNIVTDTEANFSNQFGRAGSFCFLSQQSVTILLDGSSDAILTVKSNLG